MYLYKLQAKRQHADTKQLKSQHMQDNIFKSTMTNGLIMGVLFFVNFLLTGSKILPLVLLSYLVMALIIVLMHKMTKRYRDVDCGGTIKYWKVFNYVVLTFLFAAVIASVFKIIYLQYINPEYLPALFEEGMRQIEENRSIFEKLNLPLDDDYFSTLEKTMRPVTYSIQTIWVNVLLGFALGLILGFILKKEKSIFEDDSLSESQHS